MGRAQGVKDYFTHVIGERRGTKEDSLEHQAEELFPVTESEFSDPRILAFGKNAFSAYRRMLLIRFLLENKEEAYATRYLVLNSKAYKGRFVNETEDPRQMEWWETECRGDLKYLLGIGLITTKERRQGYIPYQIIEPDKWPEKYHATYSLWQLARYPKPYGVFKQGPQGIKWSAD